MQTHQHAGLLFGAARHPTKFQLCQTQLKGSPNEAQPYEPWSYDNLHLEKGVGAELDEAPSDQFGRVLSVCERAPPDLHGEHVIH
jgi:hypothetical protein